MTYFHQRCSGAWRAALCGLALLLSGVTLPAWSANVLTSTPFEVDGNAEAVASGKVDWKELIGAGGSPTAGGAANTRLVIDEVGIPGGPALEDFFTTGGSKDQQSISSWRNKTSGSSTNPDKDNITNAYVTTFTTSGGDTILYFGGDRFAQDGDAQIGFWFFQKGVSADLGTGKFTGVHTAKNAATGQRGDILVIANFVGGGSTSNISVYEWVGSGGSEGSVNLIATSGDKAGPLACIANNNACAVTNTVAISSPVAYTPKSGTPGMIPSQGFFEGGIDITALGLTGCFSSFLAETRSSQSITATLKDFASGPFQSCGIIADKTCSQTSPPYLNSDQTTIHSTYDVLIKNVGSGTVYDIKLAEKAGATCKLTAVDGAPTSQTFSGSTPLDVAGSLMGGKTVNLTVECDSSDNPLGNVVTATASSRAGLVPSDIPPADGAGACDMVKVDPKVSVSKTCKAVTLDPYTLLPQVCVDIKVTNTGDTLLSNLKVTDEPAGNSPLDFGSLAAGAEATQSLCYTPSAIDGGPQQNTLTKDVKFSDTATVTGNGPFGTTVKNWGSVTCALCTCTNCSP